TEVTISELQWIIDELKAGKPVYYHCQNGADRTGTMGFLIVALLGMGESDLAKDYELTTFCEVDAAKFDPTEAGFARLRNYEGKKGSPIGYGDNADEYKYAKLVEKMRTVTPTNANYQRKIYNWFKNGKNNVSISEEDLDWFIKEMVDYVLVKSINYSGKTSLKMNPGDTYMGMNLAHGGHLSHGSPVNMSGKYFNCVPYGVNDDGFIDYDEVRRIALECKPKMIVCGASAYPREIDFKRFREIADEVGAVLMADIAHIAGLVATGLHMSPIPYAHITTTTTHKTLRGPRGGMIMCSNEVNERFNFNKAVFPGIQGGPLMHVIAAKAVSFKEALSPEFKEYQTRIKANSAALAKAMMERGFNLVSGGTENHLMLVNLLNLGVTGKATEKLLDAANITCNKNAIPNDPASPFVTSGIRLGTAAVSARGMQPEDMVTIAEAIKLAVIDNDQETAKALVKTLTDKYPLYEELA
ncbi:MAG: serine hydroxymethyltransferase, partial [Lachnospiraceae bacterium]|nr:serine hydroxymethyltransferase [Lachnospiraceae bacterium]